MTTTDPGIPYSQLVERSDGTWHLPAEVSVPTFEVLGALLMSAIREHVEQTTDSDEVSVVTVSINVTGTTIEQGDLVFAPRIDRMTKTLCFVTGFVMGRGNTLLTANAVYRH